MNGVNERNQILIADLKDGPLSNYEMACWQDCSKCQYCDQKALAQMKALQVKKDWINMCKIKWCNYGFRREVDMSTNPWTCKNWELIQ